MSSIRGFPNDPKLSESSTKPALLIGNALQYCDVRVV